MASLIRARVATTPQMLQAFGDEALIAGALAFEAGLARAQAREGLIPAAAAEAIAAACREPPDVAWLAEAAAHAGAMAIPMVEELRRRVQDRDPAAAPMVHRGATSQDVADTALMLQAKAGLSLIEADVGRITGALRRLAEAHAATPMLARTLLQPAQLITFGLKAAQWRLGVADAVARLRRESVAALRLQLGGPAGVLVGFEGRGPAVAKALAQELGLGVAPASSHARRDAVAGLGAALAILVGALAKIARDVALMAQAEVAEAFEPLVEGRGGSSAMAHKRNPTGCQVTLSAAVRAPQLAATLMSAMPGEHERGLGGWQAEGPVLEELFLLAAGAARTMAEVAEGLDVRPDAMARNLGSARVAGETAEAEALTALVLMAGDA
jgi:3-carboxy-cis,cis-muconate cycloisomerase